ncbi:hypothetical protein IJG14_04170 [bacterium]|nr:hypothetical protein [bacterium]
MIKKRIEYTFFAILNICLSSFGLIGAIVLYISFEISSIITKIIEKYHPSLLYHDDGIISPSGADTILPINEIDIFCSFYGIPFFSILLKILIFPILYKIKFFSNIQDFLKRFATDKNFLIKVLFSILIFDIIVYLLTTFFTDIDHTWRYTENLITNLPIYLMTFGGVLPCYLTFLLWYKWTHSQ